MIITSASRLHSSPLFYHCPHFMRDVNVLLKIEGLNIAGSIKLKTAKYLIKNLENLYDICSGRYQFIESSSGNLGIALSILCKEKGYRFTCVTDPNISFEAEKYIQLYGAKLIKVTERDEEGGYLGTRIKLIKEIIAHDSSYLWTNQYANKSNEEAHYQETAAEILAEIPQVDYLFVGAGTTGTLRGCARFFKQYSPRTTIVAVDTKGSVTFGYPPAKRYIPGLGTSKKPDLVDETLMTQLIDDIVLVHEKDAITMCQFLLNEYGLLLGGSTGSVMHAVKNYQYKMREPTVVAISPDMGNKYIHTIYNQDWVKEKMG